MLLDGSHLLIGVNKISKVNCKRHMTQPRQVACNTKAALTCWMYRIRAIEKLLPLVWFLKEIVRLSTQTSVRPHFLHLHCNFMLISFSCTLFTQTSTVLCASHQYLCFFYNLQISLLSKLVILWFEKCFRGSEIQCITHFASILFSCF